MRSAVIAIGAGAALANAAAIRSSGCQVHFQATGDVTGTLGELKSGQVVFGGDVGETAFTINGDKVYDPNGHGCEWTPPNKVFQCDTNSQPAPGWDIDCHGAVSFNGQTTFYECDAANGQHDVYLVDGKGVNCKPIGLTADGCHKDCAPPPPPPPPSGCPTDLSGTYEYPHLIIPVDSSQPDKAAGTSYNGTVSKTVASAFDFDIPAGDEGKTCSLVFLFPKKEDLETSSFSFSGDGKLDFAELEKAVTEGTTYNNLPKVKKDYGVTTVAPGNSYRIATFDCPAGERVAFEVKNAGSTELNYFQDYNPSPIGLYITVC